MKHLANALFALTLKFGGPGLLVLGILDSSFLFAPLGNDLLVVVLIARHPAVGRLLYYAGMSTIGSVLGCLLVDLVMRPVGEKGLEKYLPPKRIQRIKARVQKGTARTLAFASIAPPPFPFTPFVMAASALQYSRHRMLATVAVARMVRFTAIGLLSWRYGVHILKWAKSPAVQDTMIGLVIFFTVGSAVSVYGWIKKSRSGDRNK